MEDRKLSTIGTVAGVISIITGILFLWVIAVPVGGAGMYISAMGRKKSGKKAGLLLCGIGLIIGIGAYILSIYIRTNR